MKTARRFNIVDLFMDLAPNIALTTRFFLKLINNFYITKIHNVIM